MLRLAPLALIAAALPACVLDTSTPYEVTVEWTSSGTHTDSVSARITHESQENIVHGTLESNGYAGSTLITGETNLPSFELCVELGNYEWVTTESGYGCESGDYECDTTTTREFVASRVQCTQVTPDQTTVQLTF